jgi:hypothetical protein
VAFDLATVNSAGFQVNLTEGFNEGHGSNPGFFR